MEEFNEIEEFKRAYIEKYNESPEAASKWVHDLLFDMRLKHENKMVSFKIGGLKAPGKDK